MKSFFNKTYEAAKLMHPSIWLAAVILPGGVTAIGIYLLIKGMQQPDEEENTDGSRHSEV